MYDDFFPPQSSPPSPLPRNTYSSPDDPFRNSQNSRPERQPPQDAGRRPSQDDPLDLTIPTRSLTDDPFNVVNPNFRTPSPEPSISAQCRPSSSSSYVGRQPAWKPSQDYPSVSHQPPGRKSSGKNQTLYGNSSSQATAGVTIPYKSTIAEDPCVLEKTDLTPGGQIGTPYSSLVVPEYASVHGAAGSSQNAIPLPRRHGNAHASALRYPIHELRLSGTYDDPSVPGGGVVAEREDEVEQLLGGSYDLQNMRGLDILDLQYRISIIRSNKSLRDKACALEGARAARFGALVHHVSCVSHFVMQHSLTAYLNSTYLMPRHILPPIYFACCRIFAQSLANFRVPTGLNMSKCTGEIIYPEAERHVFTLAISVIVESLCARYLNRVTLRGRRRKDGKSLK